MLPRKQVQSGEKELIEVTATVDTTNIHRAKAG